MGKASRLRATRHMLQADITAERITVPQAEKYYRLAKAGALRIKHELRRKKSKS
jgi:hypothetical protein